MPLRPDWENVITPVVDYLLTRPDTDPARIVLNGLSLGGYLAPRAACPASWPGSCRTATPRCWACSAGWSAWS